LDPPPSDDSRFTLFHTTDSSGFIRLHSLTIGNVSRDDSGVYACIAMISLVDMDKTVKYRTANINVNIPGTIKKLPLRFLPQISIGIVRELGRSGPVKHHREAFCNQFTF
jgi:hypothetical protein